ncbi:SRPBCC family protein [Micromonospora sp. WMMA1363]|uniref:type II toxin-antitoxin system RatA family toxin n=1 Tax=Micromonospora sp. WMMA1363 TaxID=3053985 RepID=UPI00259CB277|nr:SRPBCC family protein [Micromonospora sp. WMMA1363]MDM4721528.1 SRPBCC family protein [Micromonospora sp. WMMA1363]
MPTITAETHVARPAAQVWAAVRSAATLASQAPHVVDVRADGASTHWTVLLNGSEVAWEQRDDVGPGTVLRFTQITGDLEEMSGSWEVAEAAGGARVRLTIVFELGVDGLAPLLEPIWAQSLQAHAEALLRVVPAGSENL